MGFSTRRGRPRKNKCEERDRGTPELRAKRRCGITSEAIDLCLARSIINSDQHWCGMHLRWLHTLRFGVADAKTSYATHFRETGGVSPREDSWTDEREQEYGAAIDLLKSSSTLLPVMKICVYNEKPAFLYPPLTMSAKEWRMHVLTFESNITPLREGLDGLVRIWIRNRPHSRIIHKT